MLVVSNSRPGARIAALSVGALLALATSPALADGPDDDTGPKAKDETSAEANTIEAGSSDLALDLTMVPRPAIEPPKLEIEVPLGESTRAVADFVAEFVTTGVVINERDAGSPDERVHRVRGSYKRGALALTWRVSF